MELFSLCRVFALIVITSNQGRVFSDTTVIKCKLPKQDFVPNDDDISMGRVHATGHFCIGPRGRSRNPFSGHIQLALNKIFAGDA